MFGTNQQPRYLRGFSMCYTSENQYRHVAVSVHLVYYKRANLIPLHIRTESGLARTHRNIRLGGVGALCFMKSLLQRPVAFHPALARLFGGIPEAIYWQQLHYWSDKGKRPDGYIYKTKEEIEEETTLTREQQDRVRKKLEELGFLETKLMKANNAPTLHYKVNARLVEKTLLESCESHYSDSCESHYSITESTTENTIGGKKQKKLNKVTKDNLSNNSESRDVTYSVEPVDDDGNPIPKRKQAAKPQYGKSTFRVVNRFIEKAEQVTGVKPPTSSKQFFTVQGAAKRNQLTEEDFDQLFDYFFNDRLSVEQKTSLQLVCSDNYITKWKAHQQNRPISQIEAAEGIRL